MILRNGQSWIGRDSEIIFSIKEQTKTTSSIQNEETTVFRFLVNPKKSFILTWMKKNS